MIEAGFEFQPAPGGLPEVFMPLPPRLRPTHFSDWEKIDSRAGQIDDQARFADFSKDRKSGFFLLAPAATYSIRTAAGKPTICDCFLDVEPTMVIDFMTHIATALPLFGFACAPEERERRNRISIVQGTNQIDSWVGRGTDKYIPGLYWLTLLSDDLAKRHGISLLLLEKAALEYTRLTSGQHLFRFYERPEDWKSTNIAAKLCSSLPGVFDIEELKNRLSAKNSFIDISLILAKWS